MKAHVYLDALISLHRMPNHICKPLDVLSDKDFKGMSIEALRLILERFGQKQELTNKDMTNKKGQNQFEDHSAKLNDIKFVKTKDLQKVLMCNIIAVSIYLAQFNRIRGSVLARTLKKDISELKNYIKEIGLSVEPFKNDKTGDADLHVFLREGRKNKNDKEIGSVVAVKGRAKSEEIK